MFCFKQKTAYEMRISDWSSDVCSSDLRTHQMGRGEGDVHQRHRIRGKWWRRVGCNYAEQPDCAGWATCVRSCARGRRCTDPHRTCETAPRTPSTPTCR